MKIYRVIIKFAGTDTIKAIKVTDRRASATSIKGYWGSRYSFTQHKRLYDVEVETLFAVGWQPLNEEVEKIEGLITKLQASSLDQAEVFAQQILDRIQYEKDRDALRRLQATEVSV
jgi:hypothetical protein